jgi:cytochrome c6
MTTKIARLSIVMVLSFAFSEGVFAENTVKDIGEEKFKALCAMCHPGGGNIVNPKKTLHKGDRESNNIKTTDDIIKLMRNPGPKMTKFNEKSVPEKEAQAIADYVLKTFN